VIRGLLNGVWKYRSFILGSVKREFQAKYRNSLFGFWWVLASPLFMIAVYFLVFSEIMQSRLPGEMTRFGYGIFLCSGIIAWTFSLELVNRSTSLFIENANLLKKVSFPRSSLTVISILVATSNFLISFAVFSIVLILIGRFPGPVTLALIPVFLIQVTAFLGIGLIFGVLNVFFRDIGHFLGIFMQFWFWLTPIVYPTNILPEKAQSYVELNPLTGIIQAYQSVMLSRQTPDWNNLIPAMVFALIALSLGFYLFQKHNREMVDEL
jgi:lipopolysaccharide transport system permease protein